MSASTPAAVPTPSTAPTAPVLQVALWRSDEAVPAGGRFVRYEVPSQPSQTVLDVVTYVQRRLEPTLAYRFACRVGMCGSCAMTVNGRARWTCRTHVAKVLPAAGGAVLEIAPLAHLPVIRDLVVDMSGFFDRWARADGRFHGAATRQDDFARVRPDTARRRAADAGIECIGCGVCAASCDVVRWRPDFLGPAALNRAWTLVNDERDTHRRERLAAVAGDAGCHACHTQGSCSERCPKGIAPTVAIAGLKREAGLAALRGEL